MRLIWSILALSVLVAMLYGVWQLTRLPSLTISTVEIEAGETVALAELEEIVNQTLAGTYFLSLIHISEPTRPY